MRTPLLTSSCIAISSFAVALLGSGCLLISKTRGGNTPAEVDPKVAATLGESARYSVRAAQGASSLCPVDDPTDQPLGVWAVEGGASPELWCFPVPKARFGASTDWGTVRAIQDASALRTVLENTEADERGLSLTFDDAGMIAMIEHAGGEFAVARIALPGPAPGRSRQRAGARAHA